MVKNLQKFFNRVYYTLPSLKMQVFLKKNDVFGFVAVFFFSAYYTLTEISA